MSKLKELEDSIRKELPELMEISRGCVLKYNEKLCIVDSTTQDERLVDVRYVYGQNIDYFALIDGWQDYVQVIGHEIQLHHVLKWFNVWLKMSPYKNGFRNGFSTLLIMDINKKGIFYKWNLDKSFKDQSEDLINYLHSLINHEGKIIKKG